MFSTSAMELLLLALLCCTSIAVAEDERGLRGHQRFLPGYDDWHPPTREEFVAALLEEIQAANQTVNLDTLVMAEWSDIQHSVPEYYTDEERDALEQSLDMPGDSPEVEALVEATMIANQGEGRRQELQALFLQYLQEHELEGSLDPLDPTAIEQRVQTAMGLDLETMEVLMEQSHDFLQEHIYQTEENIQRHTIGGLANQLESLLMELANNRTDLDMALHQNLLLPPFDNEPAIASIVEQLDDQDPLRARIQALIERPYVELEEQIAGAYHNRTIRQEELASRENEHEFYVLDEEGDKELDGDEEEEATDGDTEDDMRRRHRRLRYVRHPSKPGLAQKIQWIREESERTRPSTLRRRLYGNESESVVFAPESSDAADFRRYLMEHVEELQSYGRQLQQTACSSGNSMLELECVGQNLAAFQAMLTNIQASLLEHLEPFESFLNRLHETTERVHNVKTIVRLTNTAVSTAVRIPSYGQLFRPLQLFVRPINRQLGRVNTRVRRFDQGIGETWRNHVSTAQERIESFDPSVLDVAIQTASFLNVVSENACVSGMVEAMMDGTDVVGNFRNALSSISSHAEHLANTLQPLVDAIRGQALNTFQTAIEAVLNALQPVTDMFSPLDGLAQLLQRDVHIPWISLPTRIVSLGEGRCPSGFNPGQLDVRLCWEQRPSEYEQVPASVPYRFRRTCSSGGMSGNDYGSCNNRRHDTEHHNRRVFRGCRSGFRLHAPVAHPYTCYRSRCNSGYHRPPAPFDEFCYLNQCPDGFSRSNHRFCTKHSREQECRLKSCDHFQTEPGTRAILRPFHTDCLQGCSPGSTEITGFCFSGAERTFSIEDIADAFEDITEFIEGLPIVSTIFNAINRLVGAILRPITNLISDMIAEAFDFPDFPLRRPTLRFNGIGYIGDLAQDVIPDLSQLRDLPNRLFRDAMETLDTPLNAVAECEDGDVACATSALGLTPEAIASTTSSSMELFESLRPHLDRAKSAISQITCTRWTTRQIPTSDVLQSFGLPDVDMCDLEIDFCEEFDFSNLESAFAPLVSPLQALMERAQRRHLQEGAPETLEQFLSTVDDCPICAFVTSGNMEFLSISKMSVEKGIFSATEFSGSRGYEERSVIQAMGIVSSAPTSGQHSHNGRHSHLQRLSRHGRTWRHGHHGRTATSPRTSRQGVSSSQRGSSSAVPPFGYSIHKKPILEVDIGFKVVDWSPSIQVKIGMSLEVQAGIIPSFYQNTVRAIEKAAAMDFRNPRVLSAFVHDDRFDASCAIVVFAALGMTDPNRRAFPAPPRQSRSSRYDFLCRRLVDTVREANRKKRNAPRSCNMANMRRRRRALRRLKGQAGGIARDQGRARANSNADGTIYVEAGQCVRYWYAADNDLKQSVHQYLEERQRAAGNQRWDFSAFRSMALNGTRYSLNHLNSVARQALNDQRDRIAAQVLGQEAEETEPPTPSPTAEEPCPQEPDIMVDHFRDMWYAKVGLRVGTATGSSFGPLFKRNRCEWGGLDSVDWGDFTAPPPLPAPADFYQLEESLPQLDDPANAVSQLQQLRDNTREAINQAREQVSEFREWVGNTLRTIQDVDSANLEMKAGAEFYVNIGLPER